MIRAILLVAVVATPAIAQHAHGGQGGGHDAMAAPASAASEPGQAAFAAIAEVVAILEADPATDWSTVDIDALRAHLVDMNAVTLGATVTRTALEDGWRFDVAGIEAGTGSVRDSGRRMVIAHAEAMQGESAWRFTAETTPTGAALAVHAADAVDVARIGALGFFGVLTAGMHHPAHHLAIARGEHPHGEAH
jgi:hypothetical protein